MNFIAKRREALFALGSAATAVMAFGAGEAQAAGVAGSLEPPGAKSLRQLTERLAATPRQRRFKTVPMILTEPDQWDSEALNEVIAYAPATKQVWDMTDIAGPWLNLMRNSLNAQIWSYRHPDFLVVAECHGTAQLALYDASLWEKYQLSRLAGEKFKTNSLIQSLPAEATDPHNFGDPAGAFSPADNSIPALMRRGVVFMACHNAIWEQSAALLKAGINPGRLSHEALAADMTNHLIEGVVLTPGAVATIPELQRAGFSYIK